MSNPYKAPGAKLYSREPRDVLSLLCSFDGRINRREFWLGLALIGIAKISLLYATSLLPAGRPWSYLVVLILLYPLLAITAKRYHDQDRTGWLGLVWFAPLVGWMFVIIECGFGKGFPMKNKYGPPKFGPLVERVR